MHKLQQRISDMPKLAANLSTLFTEVPFLERFARAARAGFKGVEFLFPYDHPPEALAERLHRHGLTQALFNLPPGDWDAGERGIAALPGRTAQFRDHLEIALPYARALACNRVHMMAGTVPDSSDRAAAKEAFLANLRSAAAFFEPHGVTVVIEPINRRDIPGYFLNRQDQAAALLQASGAANVGLQMDFYHCQIVEGDLAMKLRQHFELVQHVQIAGVPDRHEPDLGEINYGYVLPLLDELGYDGWVGCEYHPAAGTEHGLAWAQRYGVNTP